MGRFDAFRMVITRRRPIITRRRPIITRRRPIITRRMSHHPTSALHHPTSADHHPTSALHHPTSVTFKPTSRNCAPASLRLKDTSQEYLPLRCIHTFDFACAVYIYSERWYLSTSLAQTLMSYFHALKMKHGTSHYLLLRNINCLYCLAAATPNFFFFFFLFFGWVEGPRRTLRY